MSKAVRILLVEDSEDDALLLLRSLRQGGYEPELERVQSAEAMSRALATRSWDVVISDYHLPQFSAPAAFALLTSTGIDLPFIIVSGTVGEAAAVEAMKTGVHDYFVKGNLGLLVPAIERELREARARIEQSKMRERLVISERMAAAGTLAAGVAHEINNPLAVMMTNLDFATGLISQLGTDAHVEARVKELEEPLRDMRDALEQIRRIVRDVKLFSRPDEEGRGGVDVHAVIESSVRMAWNEIKHRAEVRKTYGDVPLVKANGARIGQVVLNLIVNAAQAMPEGNASGNEIHIVTRSEANRVIIEIRDTGGGIPKENLDRIFDPFFTTKPLGVGTGLGLSICHRIVTDLGGDIAVESEIGKGTLVRLTLPAAEEGEPLAVLVPSIAPITVKRGRILVVDDEVAIGNSLRRSLSRHHDVVVLVSGREALALVASGERFDVILSDLMMPEMTGAQMHEELERVCAEQAKRVVFLTGGAFTAAAREFLDRVPNQRLEKPFDIPTLLSVIAGVLHDNRVRAVEERSA